MLNAAEREAVRAHLGPTVMAAWDRYGDAVVAFAKEEDVGKWAELHARCGEAEDALLVAISNRIKEGK